LGHQWIWKADDRLRRLKLRAPIPGIRIKLIPTEEEIESCCEFGQNLALNLLG
jgi:flavorubredoxin